MKKFIVSIAIAFLAIPGSLMLPVIGAISLGAAPPERHEVVFGEDQVPVIRGEIDLAAWVYQKDENMRATGLIVEGSVMETYIGDDAYYSFPPTYVVINN